MLPTEGRAVGDVACQSGARRAGMTEGVGEERWWAGVALESWLDKMREGVFNVNVEDMRML